MSDDCGQSLLSEVAGMASIIADKSSEWWKVAKPYVRDLFQGILGTFVDRNPALFRHHHPKEERHHHSNSVRI